MAEDERTLWVGNLDEKVTEELLYELFLQTGPIEKLILPTEEEKDKEKHKGHAYVVFKHSESVQYAAQVLEGSSLFSQALTMKARSLPSQHKKAAPQFTSTFSSNNRGGRFDQYDNSSLRGGFSFNKSNTWHGQNNSFVPRGRGSYRGRGVYDRYNNNGGNNYNNQQPNNTYSSYSDNSSGYNQSQSTGMEDKRQRLLQQQNITLEAHRQSQYNMGNQMYGNQQQQQQQQQWPNNMGGYNTGNWNNQGGGNWNNQGGGMGDQNNMYQGYSDQYQNWYQSQ